MPSPTMSVVAQAGACRLSVKAIPPVVNAPARPA